MKSLLLFLACTLGAWGAPYVIGSSLSSIDLVDQFDKKHVIKTMPKTIVMAFEKGTAAIADECLGKQPADYLSKHHAAYIADISPMPNFVAEAFALPKMRKYPYTVLLIRDEEYGLRFPAQEEKITILRFEGNVIRQIEYAATADELKQAIEK